MSHAISNLIELLSSQCIFSPGVSRSNRAFKVLRIYCGQRSYAERMHLPFWKSAVAGEVCKVKSPIFLESSQTKYWFILEYYNCCKFCYYRLPPPTFFFFVFFFCIFPESSIKSFFFYISAMFITQQMLSLPLLCLFFSLSLLSFSVITPVVILLPVKTCF